MASHVRCPQPDQRIHSIHLTEVTTWYDEAQTTILLPGVDANDGVIAGGKEKENAKEGNVNALQTMSQVS